MVRADPDDRPKVNPPSGQKPPPAPPPKDDRPKVNPPRGTKPPSTPAPAPAPPAPAAATPAAPATDLSGQMPSGDLSGLLAGTDGTQNFGGLANLFGLPGVDQTTLETILGTGGFGQALQYKIGQLDAQIAAMRAEEDARHNRALELVEQGRLDLAQVEEAHANAVQVERNRIEQTRISVQAQSDYAAKLMDMAQNPQSFYRYMYARQGLTPPQGAAAGVTQLPVPTPVQQMLGQLNAQAPAPTSVPVAPNVALPGASPAPSGVAGPQTPPPVGLPPVPSQPPAGGPTAGGVASGPGYTQLPPAPGLRTGIQPSDTPASPLPQRAPVMAAPGSSPANPVPPVPMMAGGGMAGLVPPVPQNQEMGASIRSGLPTMAGGGYAGLMPQLAAGGLAGNYRIRPGDFAQPLATRRDAGLPSGVPVDPAIGIRNVGADPGAVVDSRPRPPGIRPNNDPGATPGDPGRYPLPEPGSWMGGPNASQGPMNALAGLIPLFPFLQQLFAQTGHLETAVPLHPPSGWNAPLLGTPSAQSLRNLPPSQMKTLEGFETDIGGVPAGDLAADVTRLSPQGTGGQLPEQVTGSQDTGSASSADIPVMAGGGMAGMLPQLAYGGAVPGQAIIGDRGPEAGVPMQTPGGPLAAAGLALNRATGINSNDQGAAAGMPLPGMPASGAPAGPPGLGSLIGALAPTSRETGAMTTQPLVPLVSVPTDKLGPNQRGPKVAKLQQALEQAGYLQMPKGANYGWYGPTTTAAVARLQSQYMDKHDYTPGYWDGRSAKWLKTQLQQASGAGQAQGPDALLQRGQGAPGESVGPQLPQGASQPPMPPPDAGGGGLAALLGM